MSASVYDSREQSASGLRAAKELSSFGHLLRMLVQLSLTLRYRRSFLGILWTLLSPLLHMLVLTVAFSTLFSAHVSRYPPYVLIGLMVWEFFGQTTTYAVNQLAWGSPLLNRVWLPAAVFPISATITGVINFLLTLLPLGVILLLSKAPLSWACLFLPVPLVFLALISLGVSLFLAPLALHFYDLINIWNVLLRAWYFLTPIMYPESIFPKSGRWVLATNPLYHLLICFREPLLHGRLPASQHIAVAGLVSVLVFLAGWSYFSRRRFDFALLG